MDLVDELPNFVVFGVLVVVESLVVVVVTVDVVVSVFEEGFLVVVVLIGLRVVVGSFSFSSNNKQGAISKKIMIPMLVRKRVFFFIKTLSKNVKI